MSNNLSKINLLQHSEAKVKLLEKYLDRYLNIICNDSFTRRIKIFDLFCGEGLYKNGGEGSPLVILRIIKNIYYSNKANSKKIPKIDCYFNDIDTQKIEKLADTIRKKGSVK